MIKIKCLINCDLPVSIFPIMTSSPLVFPHNDWGGKAPFLSNPRKFQECVVCNLCLLFKKTDMTLGCSTCINHKQQLQHQNNSFSNNTRYTFCRINAYTCNICCFIFLKYCSKPIDISIIRIKDCFLGLFYAVKKKKNM